MARSGRVPATVLQPTAVYGPYGGVWTERVLTALRTGRVILVDGGRGLANHVYVDDLVSAMLLAAVEPAAVGEAFLVSSAEPATWQELYGAFERMIGADADRLHERRGGARGLAAPPAGAAVGFAHPGGRHPRRPGAARPAVRHPGAGGAPGARQHAAARADPAANQGVDLSRTPLPGAAGRGAPTSCRSTRRARRRSRFSRPGRGSGSTRPAGCSAIGRSGISRRAPR